MKRLHLTLVSIFCPFLLFGQLTIQLTSIPTTTPDEPIYIAGNFNKWKVGDPAMKMQRKEDGTFSITLPMSVAALAYNFNRGTSATIEGDSLSQPRALRLEEYKTGKKTINNYIVSWEGVPNNSTADPNVRVINHAFKIPQLNRTRRIWLYLPPDYDNDVSKEYPVAYMFHGQQLFDMATGNGEEWKIDETLNKFHAQGQKGCIVVGVEDGPKSELLISEKGKETVTLEGRAFGEFIVNTLKPFIDTHFRTKKSRLQTAIGGSVEGGMMAMYMAMTYQNVFSKALVFSPVFNGISFDYAAQSVKKFSMNYYFVTGTDESPDKADNIEKMVKLLKAKGYAKSELFVTSKIDGEQTEWFWSREFANAYKWLFKEVPVLLQEGILDAKVNLAAIATNGNLTIESVEDLKYANIEVYDNTQRLLAVEPLKDTRTVNVSYLKEGEYHLVGIRNGEVLFVKRFVKK